MSTPVGESRSTVTPCSPIGWTERDEIGRALRAHDAGDAGDRERVALRQAVTAQ
jgi:hypothetical protein